MRRRRGSINSSSDAEELHINLTPLIDIALVVLIIFIIIAPLIEIDKIDLASAAAGKEKEVASCNEQSPIAIHVRADNSIWFEKRRVSAKELLPLLKEAKRRHPSRTPQLFHDKQGSFGTYQSVKNAAEMAGFADIDVILNPT